MPKAYNDDLFDLIKSMEPSEKRYFKLYASDGQKKKNKYVLLFEAVEKQKEFDERSLLKEKFVTQLPLLKNRLYDLVLKSLNNYNAEKSIDFELRSTANHIEILIQKKLFNQSAKLIRKAKQKSINHEQHWFYIYFLGRETDLLTYIDFKGIADQEVKKKFANIRGELSLYLNATNYKEIKTNFRKAFLERRGASLEALKKIMQNLLMISYEQAQSPFSREIFLNSNALFSDLIGNIPQAFEYNTRLIELMESRKIFMEEDPLNYAKYLQNDIGYKMELKQRDALTDSIKKIRAIKFKTNADHVHVNALLINMETAIYGSQLDFITPSKQLQHHEKFLTENNNLVQRETLIIFYFNAAIIEFANESWQKSNLYLNKIINNVSLQKVRTDIHCMVRIIKLLVYYEMQKQDLLEYSIKNAYRFINKWKHLSPIYITLLQFLKNMASKIVTYKQQVNAFQELKTKLERDIRNNSGHDEGFDIVAWLEAKVRKKTFVEILIEKQQ